MTDVVKQSFLDKFQMQGDVTLVGILITVALAFVLGLFVYLIYRLTFSGVIFVKSFGTSLIMLSMVTSLIIMVVASNIALTFGMVGALSIVRFRTAVKDPMDTIFMFWAIGCGITLGAQYYLPSLVGSAVIGVLLLVWNLFKSKKNLPFMLVLRFDEACKKEVQTVLRKLPSGKLKSKIVSEGMIELTIEMNLRESEAGMVDSFSAIPGVHNASLISYKGDVVS